VPEYSLNIKQSAQKELDSLDDALFARIDRKILPLADHPRPSGCKKLKGHKDLWRIPTDARSMSNRAELRPRP
jgi:mRNA interferase RelE/StbE